MESDHFFIAENQQRMKNKITKENYFQSFECVVDETLCPDKTTFAKSVCPHQLVFNSVCGQREMN